MNRTDVASAALTTPALLSPGERRENAPPPIVASVEMGYGHLRPAHALASALGTEVLNVDQPPLVAPEELRLWRTSRRFYEITSRASQIPFAGAPCARCSTR